MDETQPEALTVLLSSSIRGKKPLLEQIYATLTAFGYKVWSSHKGTLPVMPGRSTYDTCLAAVERCDIFFGLISPEYGSGTDGAGGKAITQLELEKAIELDKPRYLLAHEQVVAARRLLLDLSLDGFEIGDVEAGATIVLREGAKLEIGSVAGRSKLKLRKGAQLITDLRVIDMYEAATMEGVPIPERHDNWVQEYRSDSDVLLYVEEQFQQIEGMRKMLVESQERKGLGS
jgi:hypothetical protein